MLIVPTTAIISYSHNFIIMIITIFLGVEGGAMKIMMTCKGHETNWIQIWVRLERR